MTVSRELSAEYGRGFSYAEIARMVRFAECMTDERILATVSQELSWSHFMESLPIEEPLAWGPQRTCNDDMEGGLSSLDVRPYLSASCVSPMSGIRATGSRHDR